MVTDVASKPSFKKSVLNGVWVGCKRLRATTLGVVSLQVLLAIPDHSAPTLLCGADQPASALREADGLPQ